MCIRDSLTDGARRASLRLRPSCTSRRSHLPRARSACTCACQATVALGGRACRHVAGARAEVRRGPLFSDRRLPNVAPGSRP
eukprot:1779746-Alexandrium_andersonii.AAC.1